MPLRAGAFGERARHSSQRQVEEGGGSGVGVDDLAIRVADIDGVGQRLEDGVQLRRLGLHVGALPLRLAEGSLQLGAGAVEARGQRATLLGGAARHRRLGIGDAQRKLAAERGGEQREERRDGVEGLAGRIAAEQHERHLVSGGYSQRGNRALAVEARQIARVAAPLAARAQEGLPAFAVRQGLREAGRGQERADLLVAHEDDEIARAERLGQRARRRGATVRIGQSPDQLEEPRGWSSAWNQVHHCHHPHRLM